MKVFVFGSPDFGGHEIMAIKILRVVLRNNANVFCFVNSSNSRLLEELDKLEVKVKCVNFRSSKIDLILGFANPLIICLSIYMRRELKKVSAEHVIIVNGNAVANHRLTLGVVLACKKLSVRSTVYVPMLHTSVELALSRFKSFFYMRAVKRGVALSTDVLVISETWKQRVEWFSPKQSTIVVHNLVDLPVASSFRRNRLGRIPERLCFIGRYDRKQKGLDFLFDVITLISAHSTVTLDLVGDGADRDFVEAAISKLPASVAARIQQHGWLADPLQILKRCDALIMPSRVEGAPLVALEARSLGIPVFGFDVPGVNDIVPHRYLSPPFDVVHFANNILNGVEQRSEQKTGYDEEINMYFDPVRFADEVHAALALR